MNLIISIPYDRVDEFNSWSRVARWHLILEHPTCRDTSNFVTQLGYSMFESYWAEEHTWNNGEVRVAVPWTTASRMEPWQQSGDAQAHMETWMGQWSTPPLSPVTPPPEEPSSKQTRAASSGEEATS